MSHIIFIFDTLKFHLSYLGLLTGGPVSSLEVKHFTVLDANSV